MARSLQRREATLLVVLGAVAAAVWYYSGGSEAPSGSATADAAALKDAALLTAPVVRMDLLSHAEPTSEGGMRDLFKYEPRPPTPSELRRQKELQRQQQIAADKARKEAERLEALRLVEIARLEEEERRNPKPKPPPPAPTPPAIPFQYIGMLGPKESKIGVFEEGREIVIARVGETVREQFKLVDLKHDVAIIGYTKKEFRDRTKELPMKRR